MIKLYSTKQEEVVETIIKPNIKKIHQMKVSGLQDKYIAQALGMSERQFIKIKDNCKLLKDTYDDAMEILCSKLTNIVVNRALGTDGRTDKDGNLLPPDEKLAFKLLEKFDDRFVQKQEIKQTFSIEQVIKQISNEDKQKEEIEVIDNE